MTGLDDPKDLADDVLVERYRALGDDRYFAEIVTRYRKKVFLTCRRMLANDSLAEDLTQDCFHRALTRIHLYEAGNLGAWLETIARNLCINHLNSNQARAVQAIDESPAVASSTDIEADVLREDQLRNLMRILKPEERICINLFYKEGMSYEQIAAYTGYSPKGIKKYIWTGMRRLRREWQREGGPK